jgi:serine/threonine-protein kinase
MLTGRKLFQDCGSRGELIEAKHRLPGKLAKILPPEVLDNSLLSGLVSKMVAVNPNERYPNAEAADLDKVGAASFHRQLVRSNLSTEYDRELAWWLEKIGFVASPPDPELVV